MHKMHWFRSFCASAKYSQGLYSPFIHSVVSNDSVSGQWRSSLDCTDVQADLGLCCLHIPKDTFSHGMAQMKTFVNYLWICEENKFKGKILRWKILDKKILDNYFQTISDTSRQILDKMFYLTKCHLDVLSIRRNVIQTKYFLDEMGLRQNGFRWNLMDPNHLIPTCRAVLDNDFFFNYHHENMSMQFWPP